MTTALFPALKSDAADLRLSGLYGEDALDKQRRRYLSLAEAHRSSFGGQETPYFFSAPGRTELIGNHTDHQNGRVLAGAVSLDAIAAVSLANDRTIALQSEGYEPICVALDSLNARPEETGTTAALVRGIAARFAESGAGLRGLRISVSSDVLSGSGLSSSACFEVLLACILNELCFEKRFSAAQLARIGQYAENVYFGKPSGLMDQTACAVGGCVAIDFAETNGPRIEPIAFSPSAFGYALVIVDSGANHAELTEEYAAIPQEMRQVAAIFGKTVLREVDSSQLYANASLVRTRAGDRAFLRAAHFFAENERVLAASDAMRCGDMERFLANVSASGRSSAEKLQNIYRSRTPSTQGLSVAIDIAEHALNGAGAVRVHGGGFAGTIQCYVPVSLLPRFIRDMETSLFPACCHVLSIREQGCIRVF